MRKIIQLALVLVLFTQMGCYTMKAVAPAKSDVKLLTENENTSFQKKIKVWYALFGSVPISKNTTAEVIKENDLKSVRVTTKLEFIDFIIGAFTGIASIVPATIIIEGETK